MYCAEVATIKKWYTKKMYIWNAREALLCMGEVPFKVSVDGPLDGDGNLLESEILVLIVAVFPRKNRAINLKGTLLSLLSL